jgi:hypothetical protein
VGRETDRETDMTKLMVIFCNFANMPKKQLSAYFDVPECLLQHHQIELWNLQDIQKVRIQCVEVKLYAGSLHH